MSKNTILHFINISQDAAPNFEEERKIKDSQDTESGPCLLGYSLQSQPGT